MMQSWMSCLIKSWSRRIDKSDKIVDSQRLRIELCFTLLNSNQLYPKPLIIHESGQVIL